MSEGKPAVGLIGHGRWGERIAAALPAAGAELVAVAVGSTASAAALGALEGMPPVTTEARDLIADPAVEAVVIATPAPSHEALAREALLAGKDLFVEKPLCLSAGAALELEARAREEGLVMVTGHVFLYHPAIAALRRVVDEGRVGTVESVEASWLNTEPHRGDESVLWSLGPHPLSIIAWLCGTGEVNVTAAGDRDRMEIALAGGAGWSAEVMVAWDAPARDRRLTVSGSRATARFDGEAGELVLAVDGAPPEPVPFGDEPPLTAELRAFVVALQTREAPAQESVAPAVVGWLEAAGS